MDDQTIKLILDLVGTQGVEDLKRQLNSLNAEMGETVAAFGRGELSADEYEAETRRLATSTKNLQSVLDDLDDSTGKATGTNRDFGRTALGSGRIIQDFAQGGIGGILNNIEGFAAAVGLGSGAAGALTILGVAAMTWGPKLIDFAKSLAGGEEPAGKFGDALTQLDGELKKVKDQLEEYAKKEHLSNDEAAKANELNERRVELERQKAEELKRQNELKKALERQPGDVAAEAKERAAALQDSVGGEAGQMIGSLEAALDTGEVSRLAGEKNRIEDELGSFDPFTDAQAFERAKRLKAELAAVQAKQKEAADALRRKAEDFYLKAVEQGDLNAFRDVQGLIAAHPGAFTEGQKLAIRQASPEAFAADAEFDRQIEARQEAVKRRDEKAKGRRREDVDEIDRANREEASSIAEAQAAAAEETRAANQPDKGDAFEARAKQVKANNAAAQQESLARQIYQRAQGQFTPDQSRQVAAESIKLQKKGIDVNTATYQAMHTAYQAMMRMRAEMDMLGANVRFLNQGFANLARKTQSRRRTAAKH